MKSKLAIGVLAYNEEKYIESVIDELLKLKKTIFVINDDSKDKTRVILEKFVKSDQIFLINNNVNLGAGESTKKLILSAKNKGFDFLIKVDGDGQFSNNDVKKIIDLYESKGFDLIKSNRFWTDGIVGKIPKIRFFGNLIATMLMQISSGTTKLFDPLNGLFGVSTNILNHLNTKKYPKRYGYPFFITVSAIIHNFKTYQINNTVEYKDEQSDLNSFKVFFTLIKLAFFFYFKKLGLKKSIGLYQKSALFDLVALFFMFLSFGFFTYIILTLTALDFSIISSENLVVITIFLVVISIYFFILSFKEEINLRKEYIEIEL